MLELPTKNVIFTEWATLVFLLGLLVVRNK